MLPIKNLKTLLGPLCWKGIAGVTLLGWLWWGSFAGTALLWQPHCGSGLDFTFSCSSKIILRGKMTTTTELFASMKMIRPRAYEVAACAAQRSKLHCFS